MITAYAVVCENMNVDNILQKMSEMDLYLNDQ